MSLKQKKDGDLLYYVKWEGYPIQDASWVPRESLEENCANLLSQFHFADNTALKVRELQLQPSLKTLVWRDFVALTGAKASQAEFLPPQSPALPTIDDVSPHASVEVYLKEREEAVPEATENEIAKYPFFEAILLAVRSVLKPIIKEKMCVLLQFAVAARRKNYTTDVGVYLGYTRLRDGTERQMPLILLDVKGSVAGTTAAIRGHDITQLAIQCYYAMRTYDLTTVLGCLSDAHTWHIFRFKKATPTIGVSPLIEVMWAKTFNAPSYQEVVGFLAQAALLEYGSA